PVTQEQLQELLADIMWTDADVAALRRAGEVLRPQVHEILDAWYDFIGSTPHLVAVFQGPDGRPDGEYLERVRARFEQWVVDLCTREFDEHWLAYQEEIGRRHHPAEKNRTDHVESPRSHGARRHRIARVVPVVLPRRPVPEEGERGRGAGDA